MAYFPDLSDYAYLPSERQLLNVGWLARGHEFPTANASGEFLAALTTCASNMQNKTRGYHDCEFCDIESPIGAALPDGSGTFGLGMSELHVEGLDGETTYAAPSLIVHYVAAHNYDPPIEFRDAVLAAAREAD